MSEISHTTAANLHRSWWPNPWTLGAILVAALVLMPIIAVVWLAFTPGEPIWSHLLATVLPRYIVNTIVLMIGVGFTCAIVGAGTAWLITMYRFPMSRVLEWALFLPLAIPGYVGAYTLVDFLEYAGPVQTGLRDVMGYTSARDYFFPEIRTRTGAILVLSGSLFPYVYLFARAAYREQSGAIYDVARALGHGPWSRFFRVGLPLARPALAVGVAIVLMETVNDFGTVEFFAVQTLTTGIFTVWFEKSNVAGAAQISTLLLGVILLLALVERFGRNQLRFYQKARRSLPIEKVRLTGGQGALAFLACALPVGFAFVLPVAVMLNLSLLSKGVWLSEGLLRSLVNTLLVAGAAAFLTVVGAIFMVYGVRMMRQRLPKMLMPVTSIGYAAPGAVLGIGILIPLAAMDNALADLIEGLTGADIGLLMTGSVGALIFAYFVRFFAIAQGATDAAMGRVPPNLSLAARALGKGPMAVLRQVQIPLVRGSIGTALLLVFVDCVKELPATLILRPFNFDTLATRTYEQASLERISSAAPSALMIMFVGMGAVFLLARANR